MRRNYSDDDVVKAWPWFGGTPGKAARKLFAIWVTVIVLLVVGVIYTIATLQICVAAVIPSIGLIGSRI